MFECIWVIEVREDAISMWKPTVAAYLTRNEARSGLKYWRQQGFQARIHKYLQTPEVQ